MQKKSTITICICSTLLCSLALAQPGVDESKHNWPNHQIRPMLEAAESYSAADIVILKENTTFYYYSSDNEKIVKTILLKVNTRQGAAELSEFRLPESFDPAYDGRQRSDGKIPFTRAPYTNDYKVNVFAARKNEGGAWKELGFTQMHETYTRPGGYGPNLTDEQLRLSLKTVRAGDIIELFYEATFTGYGSNLFYFNGLYPKLDCGYTYIYKVPLKVSDCEFTLPVNIPDSAVSKTSRNEKEFTYVTKQIRLFNLDKINYPTNCLQARQLPHAFADFSFYRHMRGSYPVLGRRAYEYELVRPKNFEWMVYTDTTEQHHLSNDHQSMAVRKFVSTLPKPQDDTSRVVFLRSLCDTLNGFRYISPRELYLDQNNLQNVYSGDHLLKRRLPGDHLVSIYRDILRELGIFYYAVNVQDRRFGDHNFKYRAHYAYEHYLLAVPTKRGYVYLMARYKGVKYHLNEIPYYYEDGTAAFTGRNFQANMTDKGSERFRIEKLPASTFNENVRSENGVVKVRPDSAKMQIAVKENLSGQFSTLLRHLYLKEGVDSTVPWRYYRKCTDKPRVSNVKIKLNSGANEYPFRYSFSCDAGVAMPSRDTLDLTGWFSLPFNKEAMPVPPEHDYYFDFQFTDTYNYLLDFGKKTEIVNKADFSKRLSNDYYSLESDIVQNDESHYLVRVKLVVKKPMLPKDKALLLIQLAEESSRLNTFKLLLRS